MKRIACAALVAMFILSCGPAVRRVVMLTFNDAADVVTVSATTFLGTAEAHTPEAAQIDDEREALLAGRDEWSVRFANANPDSDRVSFDRKHGELQSVEHVASIPPDNLQKFFFDTPITVTFTRRDGSAELTIYPGSSDRATRQEREHVDRMLTTYSQRAAHYFQTIRGVYAYLNEKPRRAEDLFTAIFHEKNDPPARVSEDEEKLVNGVRDAIDGLLQNDPDTANLDRDFDHVFNPFPAELKVYVPGEITSIEGFTRQSDRSVEVKMTAALEAVAALEGRWITPDPLAAALNAPKGTSSQELAASIAAMPRHVEPFVPASDISAALIEKMQPAPRYRVRWIIHPAAEPSQRLPRRPGSSAGERS